MNPSCSTSPWQTNNRYINAQEILIIGCPGTGKSTLARKLAQETDLPLLHLDKYWHETNRWNKDLAKRKVEWRHYIKGLVEKPAWIMDGNYTSTLDIRIPAADLVLFLDYPMRIALLGIVQRSIQYGRKRGKRLDMPSDWQERIFGAHLLKKVLNFKHSHKPRIMKLLDMKPESQVEVIKSRKQLRLYLEK